MALKLGGIPHVTIGEIARDIGQPVHRVEYALKVLNIRGIEGVANYRLFSPADVENVKLKLADIDSRRGPCRLAHMNTATRDQASLAARQSTFDRGPTTSGRLETRSLGGSIPPARVLCDYQGNPARGPRVRPNISSSPNLR